MLQSWRMSDVTDVRGEAGFLCSVVSNAIQLSMLEAMGGCFPGQAIRLDLLHFL